MIFQKENTDNNSSVSKYDAQTIPFSSALFEITEKAAKVRTLLERKQRNEEICGIISTSSELSLINNIKKEIARENHASFSKIADLIERKILDLSEKNEKCININIKRNIEASNEAIKINSTEIIEKLLSNTAKNSDLNSLYESLVNLFFEHKENIKVSLEELTNTINRKESKISQEVCKFIRENDEKGKSIYLSQLNIIQKQYELIIRDLRRRIMFLERDVESKQIREKNLYEKIKSMDNEAKEAVLVLEEKDLKINFLNLQIKQLKDENKELTDKNTILFNKNQEVTTSYSGKYYLLKNKYLFLGVEFLHGTLEKITSSRRKDIFNILKYNSELISFNSKMSEDLAVTYRGSTKYNFSTRIPIKINENNLFGLLDVEKRIEEQEKEQNLINSLLTMVNGQNYAQLASFTKIISQKRVQIFTRVFSMLKNQKNTTL
ncbi:chromosome assembly [Cryptosporidium sp. chipmunk genotype I]|uniref:chromosome assembly n=1 Tax=Cryptosporidium sp. chipmunk genotype I TaxID=1280935 RepID=UPI00351A8FBB|nr:chromosome assembly [Cryptosporidium sp. chipmunk genotype I]